MATDTVHGFDEKFEDFNVTALADLPEIDTQSATGVTNAVVAAGKSGWMQIPIAASNDDDVGAISFGILSYQADTDIMMSARVRLSAITDNKFFIGFGDSIASADETSFSVTTATTSIDTMSDAIGFVFDNDETTPVIHCVSGNTDAIVIDKALASSYNPVANTSYVFSVYLAAGATSAQFRINGKLVYTWVKGTGTSTAVSTSATLVPGVWCYEQASAFNMDIDYIHARQARADE